MKMTPMGALMHQAQTRPKSAAFVFHEEVWSYARLAAEAERQILEMLNSPTKAKSRKTFVPVKLVVHDST